jgi:hypothetical protein
MPDNGSIIGQHGRTTPVKLGLGPEYNHAVIFGARYAFNRRRRRRHRLCRLPHPHRHQPVTTGIGPI